jgi:hypothetical protein
VTPLLSFHRPPVPQSVSHYDNSRYPSQRDRRLPFTASGNPQAADSPTAYQTRMARRLKLQSESHLRQSIGAYLTLRPETVNKPAASQASARTPAETQPSRWQSRFLTAPAPTPTQVLVNAKETLDRDIRQSQVDENTFRSMIGEQTERVPEDTMKEIMSIYGEAMTGGPSEASRGEGGA